MNISPISRLRSRIVLCALLLAALAACEQEGRASGSAGRIAGLTPGIAITGSPQLFVSLGPGPEIAVPYVRAQYRPFGTSVRGIPVQEIHPDWCKANEFTPELFPPEMLLHENESVLGEDGVFAITGKFDGINLHTALVGVYQTCKNETGFFLLIVRSTDTGKPQIAFLEQFDYPQGFAYLRPYGKDIIQMWWCSRCGDYGELQWHKEKQQFVWKELEWG